MLPVTAQVMIVLRACMGQLGNRWEKGDLAELAPAVDDDRGACSETQRGGAGDDRVRHVLRLADTAQRRGACRAVVKLLSRPGTKPVSTTPGKR